MVRLKGQQRQAPKREVLTSPYVGILAQDQSPRDETSAAGDAINAGRRKGQYALGGPHTLMVGGTGQGKGRRDLMQNIVMWGRNPVLCMSTSGDLVEGTIRKRASRGPAYLLDLSGEVQESELRGTSVQRVVSDPCALITSDDDAKMMADTLIFAEGTSGGSGSSSGDDIWKKNAARPLAALLRSGGWLPNPDTGEQIWGGGIAWVLQALDDPSIAGEDEQVDVMRPSWDAAYVRVNELLGSRHAGPLRATQRMSERQRDSVVINVRSALDPWTLSTVAGDSAAQPFTPSMLEEPGATLYVVSPMDGSAAGAACAVIEQSIQHWRRSIGREMPTLGLFLDEVANCAPLPKLASHVAVLRKYRVRMIAAVQTVIQLKSVWGEVGMEEMMRTFPSLLMLPNTPDREPYELASWFAGEVERTTSSTDEMGKTTHSSDRVEQITAAEMVPRRKGEGVLLISGSQRVAVRLPDISQTDI